MSTAGWRPTRIKYVAESNREVLPESTDPEFTFAYVDISAVTQGSLALPDELTRFRAAPSRARRRAEPHDTVISTVRTYLRAVASVPEHDEELVFSTGFAVLHPTEDVDPRFLGWYLQGDEFVSRVEAASVGVSYPAITAADIMAMGLVLPPLPEQRAIADYLDRETAQIDTLIAKQRQLAERLLERQESAWSTRYQEATSRHGSVYLGRLIESIADGPFGSSLTSSHYSDSGARVIRLGNVGVNEFRASDEAFIPMEYYATLQAHWVEPNDVVIAGLGDERWPLGRACVVPDIGPAIVKADCYRVRPSSSVTPAYLAWALSAPQSGQQFALLARGSTRARLNTSVVREATVAVPPIEAQLSMVEESKRELDEISTVISRAERLAGLAQERRAALITAAVTGQIDVRTAA